MVVDSNLHQLLDSAVKTAVYRLATSPDVHRQDPTSYNTNPISSPVDPQLHRTEQSGHRAVTGHKQQEPIDRSRVDFLYYDGGRPEYEYYYYEDGDYNELERYDIRAPNNPPPWVAAQSKFSRYTKYQKKNGGFNNNTNNQLPFSPAEQKPSIRRPHTAPANERVDVAGGIGGPISRVGNFFFNSPVGALLPLILAAPLILLGMYYLLVVNAPTPVVKERMVETATTMVAAVRDLVLNGDLLGDNAVGNLEVLGDFLLQLFSESS